MAAPPGTTPVFTIRGPLARSDLPGLCARLQTTFVGSGAAITLCDVDGCVEADLVAIDALARLQLNARRSGRSMKLNSASPDVHQLLAFVGLDDALVGGFDETSAVPSGHAARPEAASSVAPVSTDTGALVSAEGARAIASERASHPDDERRSAKPS